MEDTELAELKELKVKLLQRATNLLEKLKEQEAGNEQSATLKIPNALASTNEENDELFNKIKRKLCKVSSNISGIHFEDVDRKWIKGNTYKYFTVLTTKPMNINVELTVEIMNEKEFQIEDITCTFINIEQCYMLEIMPWVQNITRMKNFSLLTSAISQYTDLYMYRDKVVKGLKSRKYVTSEEYSKDKGGLLLSIHSPKNVDQVYLKFCWSLIFIERSWQSEHFFDINPEKSGAKFAEENAELLQDFCERSITKEVLTELWRELCSAIDEHVTAAELSKSQSTN